MSERILFVDDEENVLKAVQRLFADSGLTILTAASAEAALQQIMAEEIAVLVSDNHMPGLHGIDLLAMVSYKSPQTVKILMTGHADLPTAIEAINIGEVFRFVLKPWDNEALLATVQEAVIRYRLVQSLRHGDETVFRTIGQTIELKDPSTKGHCDRVAGYALLLAEGLGIPAEVREEIKRGSWLHDCGKIGVPDAVLNLAGPLNDREYETIKKHPVWGAEVARQARLSDRVVNIIRHHHERFDGRGYPMGLSGAAIPLEARIVAVADVYDALTTDRPYRRGYQQKKALGILTDMQGNQLDPEMVTLFKERLLELARSEPLRKAVNDD